MKKTLALILLLAGINRISVAQTTTDKTFDPGEDFVKRQFVVDLGKQNKMLVELDGFDDINKLQNLDSIVAIVVADLVMLKDSLADELSTKRIDYVLDKSDIGKIRIVQTPSRGTSYSVLNGNLSALKLEQDTINLIGNLGVWNTGNLRKPYWSNHRYRVRFLLNSWEELKDYTSLNQKISTIKTDGNYGWSRNSKTLHLMKDSSITGKWPKGYVTGGDFIRLWINVAAQNYKSYFVPSFDLGTTLTFSSHGFFKREVSLAWEPHFLFAKNQQGKLKTFRNDFLTLTFGQGGIEDRNPQKDSKLLTIISFGYLIHRDGDYFLPHTMRFGGGRLSLFEGKTKIEPVLYFNHLLKGVTPGIRWIQSF